jgi:hypothetical protein
MSAHKRPIASSDGPYTHDRVLGPYTSKLVWHTKIRGSSQPLLRSGERPQRGSPEATEVPDG